MDWAGVLLEIGIDIPLEKSEIQTLCPFHSDTRDSCSINVDKGVWICFRGCGQGSLRGFVKRILNLSWKEVDAYLGNQEVELSLDIFEDMMGDVDEDYMPEIELEYNKNRVPNWIFERGFSPETLIDWECGIDSWNNLVIPIRDDQSRLVGSVSRRMNMEPKYLYSKGLKKSKLLFGGYKIEKCPFVCITEGTLDAMWLEQNGYPAVALLGAHLSRIQQELLIQLPTDELVLCLDNDEAGQIGLNAAMACISERSVVSYIQIPNEFKDVQDIRNTNKLENIINKRTFFI